jgi:hypothetical protein
VPAQPSSPGLDQRLSSALLRPGWRGRRRPRLPSCRGKPVRLNARHDPITVWSIGSQ